MSGVFYLCDVLKFIIHGLYKCSLSQADLIRHTHERVSHIVLDFCDELYSIYKETFKKSFSDISFITKEFSLDVFKQCALLKRFPVIHDWKRVLFGFCVLFVMSIVIDYVVNSNRQSVQFLIFSKKHEMIAETITKELHRGVTLLDGTGWYSKQNMKVVVVLAKKNQSTDIFRMVRDIDENAFISQSNVVSVYGEGFDKLKVKKTK